MELVLGTLSGTYASDVNRSIVSWNSDFVFQNECALCNLNVFQEELLLLGLYLVQLVYIVRAHMRMCTCAFLIADIKLWMVRECACGCAHICIHACTRTHRSTHALGARFPYLFSWFYGCVNEKKQ